MAVAIAAFVSGCGNSIAEGIESANDLLYKKQYVASERLFHKLLKRLEDRSSLDDDEEAQRLLILDRLGKINALYLHDYKAAIGFYEKLVEHYPKTDQAFAARATVADIYHHKLGNLEAAISEYQKIVVEFPTRDETRWYQLQIAEAYFQLRDFDQARTEAEALITRWPKSNEASQARFQIANSYYVQGRYTEAIATYEQLLQGEPEKSLASLVLFELGNCFQELDDPDRALAYYYACLSDHPNPLLVQRKIKRLRARLHRTRPAQDIELPAYVQRRLAVVQQGSTAMPKVQKPRPAGGAPEDGVFKDSVFDATDGQLTAGAPPAPPKAGAGSEAAGTKGKADTAPKPEGDSAVPQKRPAKEPSATKAGDAPAAAKPAPAPAPASAPATPPPPAAAKSPKAPAPAPEASPAEAGTP